MPEQRQAADKPIEMPERLGRYRLVRSISTGGMAHVFEGRRESLAGVAPRVAVKIILPNFAGEARFRELFINEARIGSMLHHQNLVQIQDFDAEGDLYYIVMEYVEGVTIRRAVSRARRNGRRIPTSIIAEIGRQVCDGLHHAHTATSEEGRPLYLVHRDIKPSNLMLNPQGVVKVLDFGISKALISNERRGAVRGTWGYMSPEQADGGDVSGASDLFGLGAVLYEIAAQEPLFAEKDPARLRGLLARDEAARRANRLARSVGAPLAGVLIRAMQRDPSARFPDAASMGRALGDLIQDPVTAREELVQFQRLMVELGASRAPAAPSVGSHSSRSLAPGSAEPRASRPASGSAQSRSATGSAQRSRSRGSNSARSDRKGGQGGLPVGVGSRSRPVPRAPGERATLPPLRRKARRPRRNNDMLKLGVVFGMVSLLGLGWWLHQLRQRVSPNASVAVSSTNQHEGGTAANSSGRSSRTSTHRAPSANAHRGRVESRSTSRTSVSSRASVPDPPSRAPTKPRDSPVAPTVVVTTPAASAQYGSASESTRTSEAQGESSLTISSLPRAQVVVDGQFIRYSPMFRHAVTPGEHVVTLIADDGQRKTFRVDVPTNDNVRRVWSFESGAFVGE